MLSIQNLKVAVEDKIILDNFNLELSAGTVHAIMGPNGAGKSTLASVIARKPGYNIAQGSITYQEQDVIAMSPEECAWAGIFLGFQYPISIPGVSNMQFLKSAVNAIRRAKGEKELDAIDFFNQVKTAAALLEIEQNFLSRGVNEGFSGGEKKRNEILQMLLINPSCAILDETDSGLDIDALKIVARGINTLRNDKKVILLITHYQRLLDYVQPDFVHIMDKGRIVKSGDKSLATLLEQEGYANI